MNAELTVDRFLQRELLTCPPDTPVRRAAMRMRDARCGSILIVESGVPVGIWTETDALSDDWLDAGRLERPIGEVMSSPVLSVPPTTTLNELAWRFRQEGVRHLLVVDAAGAPLGMVSQTDVVRHQGVEFFVHVREVGSVVSGLPLSVDAAQPLAACLPQLRARGTDAAVVRDGERLGIVTTRDVLRALSDARIDRRVGDLASFPLLCVARDDSLFQARRLFSDHAIRHLGVVDAQGGLIGLLSFRDIIEGIEVEYVRSLRAELQAQVGRLRQSEEAAHLQATLHEAILDALPVNVFVKDDAGKLILVNDKAAQSLGRRREELLGLADTDLFPSGQAARMAEDDARARGAGRTIVREETLPDGRTLLVHRRAISVGAHSPLIAASIDVTEWKRADALMVSGHHVLELIASGAELSAVLDAICLRMEGHLPGARCSILLLDAEGKRLRHGAGPSLPAEYCRKVDGTPVGPSVGSCGSAVYNREPVVVEDIASSPLWADFAHIAEQYGLRACWSTPFFAADRSVLGTFAIYFDTPRRPEYPHLMVISHATRLATIAVERWRQISELRHLATTDPLTGLANRAHFLDQVEEEMVRSDRFRRPLALLMIDLDRFKRINDQHGHAAGDEVLRVFARVLGSSLRSVDLCGRLGGEEFAVLMPETDLAGALPGAERLRQAIEAARVDGVAGGLAFTASFGVAVRHGEEPLKRLMARADAALYAAKHGGRNRVEVAGNDAPAPATA